MMPDDRLLAEYLRRAYHAVDGLWFVMAEEAHDFEHALELDRRVWEVLAKIQARKARDLLDAAGNSPEELARCFTLKLTADGHAFGVEVSERDVTFAIRDCPWLELLRRSDRRHLAARVAQTICPTEGRAWCAEFGGEYDFEMPRMACVEGEGCVMQFRRARK
jgi:hypothetical protein